MSFGNLEFVISSGEKGGDCFQTGCQYAAKYRFSIGNPNKKLRFASSTSNRYASVGHAILLRRQIHNLWGERVFRDKINFVIQTISHFSDMQLSGVEKKLVYSSKQPILLLPPPGAGNSEIKILRSALVLMAKRRTIWLCKIGRWNKLKDISFQIILKELRRRQDA